MTNCLGCNAIESGPVVTLHDGRIVCNACPDWMQECEARELLRLPEDEIQDALAVRQKKRGSESVNQLRAVMATIYRNEMAPKK